MHSEIEIHLEDLSSPPVPHFGADEVPKRKKRFRRNQVACDPCHMRRVRCDLISPSPCSRCTHAGIKCGFTRKLRKRGRTARSKLGNIPTEHSQCESRLWINNHSSAHSPSSQSSPSSMGPTTPESVAESWPPATNEIDSLLALLEDENHTTGDTSQGWEIPELSPREPFHPINQTSDGSPHSSFQVESPVPPPPVSWDSGYTNYNTEHEPIHIFTNLEDTNLDEVNQSAQQPPLRYPVLNDVMGFLGPHVPCELICHLIERYFCDDLFTNPHMVYGQLKCSLLRKSSLLGDRYRPTKPALLMSMLWMAAVNDLDFSFSSSSAQQSNFCRSLGRLTFSLLPQLSEQASSGQHVSSPAGLPSLPTPSQSMGDPVGDVDDVITYIHIASICSAEENPSSLKWWKAAIHLAKKLKLNSKADILLDSDDSSSNSCEYCGRDSLGFAAKSTCMYHDVPESNENFDNNMLPDSRSVTFSYESLEERRRAWWLLYIMDRHLALRHNLPLEILDAECAGVLLPMNETSWQNGNFVHRESHSQTDLNPGRENRSVDRIFPDFRFNDSSLFGFLLPLMTITGKILCQNQARSQPQHDRDTANSEISQHLDVYQTSLATLITPVEAPSPEGKDSNKLSDQQHHTSVIYASFFVQALRMMLVGKRNWGFLVEDEQCWTSPAFASTISYSLNAASCLRRILHFDPDASFCPFFFGIQLFQVSFPMLLIVERLQEKCGKDVLNACEVMIRATEACLVTRNTDYQKRLRQLMRSAVSQSWGRPVSASDTKSRRKAVFALYLWTRRGMHWPDELGAP
ncbi:unnamed protein product [Penicillium olsonii]|nr:unnamed protein product [Penicillium olsonii]